MLQKSLSPTLYNTKLKVSTASHSSGSGRPPLRLRFGVFELNLNTHELTRGGRRVEVQEQPLRIIALLAQRAGELVTREELQQRLWAGDTFVDFEAGLKSAIWKARQALGDGAANPRFIETVPRQGYRFIAPVNYEMVAFAASAEKGSLAVAPRPTPVEEQGPPPVIERSREIIPMPAAPRRRGVWRIALACCAVVLLGIGALIWNRAYPPPPNLDRVRPFANARGQQAHPAFSPNGEVLAFDWRGPSDQHACVYVQRLDGATSQRLTPGLVEELRPVWSNDGNRIAFLRNVSADRYAILTVPLVGKGERLWTQIKKGATAWFDWSGDGKWFVFAESVAPDRPPSIVLFSLATGEKRTLTLPPSGWRGDSEPAFSPDSSHVAFRRTMPNSSIEDIYFVPITGGEPTRLTFDNRTVSTLTFTPDDGLLFSSARFATNRSLWWKAPFGGQLHRLTAATVDAVTPAVSRNGKHFAFTKVQLDLNIWRVNADGSGGAAPAIDSEFADSSPNFSPDGRRILFQSSRTGTSDIWVCDANGADAARLTDSRGAPIGAAKWSPDGRQIAFDWRPLERSGIYVMAGDGGNTKVLVSDSSQNSVPAWSHDGRFIYFSSTRSGRSEIWKTRAEGGPAVQISRQGGFAPQGSPDGKFIYYFRDAGLWRMPLADATPSGPESQVTPVALRPGDWGNWVPANDGIYYIRRKNNGGAEIDFFDFARQTDRTVYVMPKAPIFADNGLSLSPDGKVLLFVEVDRDDSSIFVQ